MSAKLLVIDDQPAMQRLVVTILKQENYEIRSAFSVSEALELIFDQLPDLVCCDLMMPERSGLDFLIHCRQTETLSKLPVIIITGTGEEDMAKKALALGAYAFLAKPFSRTQLSELVKAALRHVGQA
jgi:two-component system, OmpR family, phosphate regulon response regulator PhoB